MLNKVRYFLQQNKGREWSGPAWYSVEYQNLPGKKKYPLKITLEYFHPLHLGDGTSTDWDGDKLQEIWGKLRKQYPEIGKKWEQGNIHSHHSMGAYYSTTDEQQCEDGANENFYYSLVVSTKPQKEFYFGFSFPDQFGQIEIVQGVDVKAEEVINIEKDWKQQQKNIKKNAKKEEKTLSITRYGFGRRQQGTLFDSSSYQLNKKEAFSAKKEKDAIEAQAERYNDHVDEIGYMQSYGLKEKPLEYGTWIEYDNIMLDWERGRIKTEVRDKRLQEIGVDEDGRSLP